MLRPTVLLLAEVAVLYAGLFVAGFWVSRTMRKFAPGFDPPVTTLLGLVVLQVVGWYTSSWLDTGLDRLWPWFFGVSALAAIGLSYPIFRRAYAERRIFSTARRKLTRESVSTALTGFGCAVMVVIQRHDLLERGLLTVSTTYYLSDVAAYDLYADNLRRGGFSSNGGWNGLKLGLAARDDVYGAYAYLAYGRWATGRLGFQLALATMLVVTILLGQCIARLVARWTTLPTLAVTAAALTPLGVYLFAYMSEAYFLSQVAGMALAVAFLDMATRDVPRRSHRFAAGVCIALLTAGLLMMYPHMAFLFPPLVAPCVIVYCGFDWRRWIRRGLGLVAATLMGMMLVLSRTSIATDRLVTLNSVVAGWPLPGVLPWGLLGFQSSFRHTVSATTVIGSVVVIAISIAASWSLLRRSGERWAAVLWTMGVGTLASYGVVYFLRGGPNYDQWKWISFLQPFVVIAVLAPIAEWIYRRVGTARFGIGISVLLGVVLVMDLVIAQTNPRTVDATSPTVSLDLGTLGRMPALRDVSAVNIDLSPDWETMWAATAVAPRTTYVVSRSYFAPSAPLADWTIFPLTTPWTASAQQPIRALGDHYLLIHTPIGPTSNQTTGLAGTVAASLSGAHLDVTVQNSGMAAWLGEGRGTVNVGVQLLDSDGATTQPDFARISIVKSPYILASGQIRNVAADLPAFPAGTAYIRVDLVAEEVSWFGAIGGSTPIVLPVAPG